MGAGFVVQGECLFVFKHALFEATESASTFFRRTYQLTHAAEHFAAHAHVVSAEVFFDDFAFGPLSVVDDDVEFAFVCVKADDVAITQFGQRTAFQCFRSEVDSGRYFTGSTGHTTVGDQRDLEATVLQYAEERCQFVQFRHAVGFRTLEADNDDNVTVQLARFESGFQLVLIAEDTCRCFNFAVFRLNGRRFDDAAAEVTVENGQTTRFRERFFDRCDNVFVEALFRTFTPYQFVAVEERFFGIGFHTGTEYGRDVGVDQAAFDQLASQEAHATCCVEVVHVSLAVRVNLHQARYDSRQLGEVIPRDGDARSTGHSNQVHGVVSGTTRCQQTNDCVDDGTFVDLFVERSEFAALFGHFDRTLSRIFRQRITQRRVRVDERGTRQVQTHQLNHQLVGVCSTVEGAGTRCVVGRTFGIQQFFTANFAFSEFLANFSFLLVGDTGRHRASRNEDGRQVTETSGTDEQARYDLVADTEVQRGVEHVVRQTDGRGHGDGVAGEQRQFHTRLTLSDTVTHGRNTTSELGSGAYFTSRFADQIRKDFERLVSRQHVVVSGDDAQVGAVHQLQRLLVVATAGGNAVSQVTAVKLAAVYAASFLLLHVFQIQSTTFSRTFLDALSDPGHCFIHGHFYTSG
ncbi:transposase [Zymobacter palmae]|uniref:Transposase n=1 Tax=Zymobacter palmae TaxID=33074 RepID=A0A348HD94_9GAMM|nr:transposase [Zymobacter palmae]